MVKHTTDRILVSSVDEQLFKPVKMAQMKQVLLLPILGIGIGFGIFFFELVFKCCKIIIRQKKIMTVNPVQNTIYLPYAN